MLSILTTSKHALLKAFYLISLGILPMAAGAQNLHQMANPVGLSNGYQQVTPVGNRFFFTGPSTVYGYELWVGDGPTATAHLVKDIFQSTGGSNPTTITAFGRGVVFIADDGLAGRQLWMSDGSELGTKPVAGQTVRIEFISKTTVIGHRLFFIGIANNKNNLYSLDTAGRLLQVTHRSGPVIQVTSPVLALGGKCLLFQSDSLLAFGPNLEKTTLAIGLTHDVQSTTTAYGAVAGNRI